MTAYSSATYQTLRAAMANKVPVQCNYRGLLRLCCPHTLGYTNGEPRVLMFQYDGCSSRGLPPGGEWRCMSVVEITNLVTIHGLWHTAPNHSRPQTCVKQVEFEVVY